MGDGSVETNTISCGCHGYIATTPKTWTARCRWSENCTQSVISRLLLEDYVPVNPSLVLKSVMQHRCLLSVKSNEMSLLCAGVGSVSKCATAVCPQTSHQPSLVRNKICHSVEKRSEQQQLFSLSSRNALRSSQKLCHHSKPRPSKAKAQLVGCCSDKKMSSL